MKKYKANPDFVMREIAGEVLLVPAKEQAQKLNGMITFSETGGFLWKKLQNESSIDELTAFLIQEYSVDETTAKNDVEQFIINAYNKELIVEC